MSVIILDNFTATNGTNLNGRTPSPTNTPGNNWAVKAGTWDIQTNKATSESGATPYVHVDTGQTVFTAQCKIYNSPSSINGRSATGATAPKWEGYVNTAGTKFSIYEDDVTLRADMTDTFVSGDTYSIDFSAGDVITITHNAATTNYTSSVGNTNTFAGMMTGAAVKSMDDFQVSIAGTTFSKLVSPGGLAGVGGIAAGPGGLAA